MVVLLNQALPFKTKPTVQIVWGNNIVASHAYIHKPVWIWKCGSQKAVVVVFLAVWSHRSRVVVTCRRVGRKTMKTTSKGTIRPLDRAKWRVLALGNLCNTRCVPLLHKFIHLKPFPCSTDCEIHWSFPLRGILCFLFKVKNILLTTTATTLILHLSFQWIAKRFVYTCV